MYEMLNLTQKKLFFQRQKYLAQHYITDNQGKKLNQYLKY